jgi:flagellar motor switch protein FliM
MNPAILSDTELMLLLKRARSSAPAGRASAAPEKIAPFDFQSSGQLSAAQLTKLSDVHAPVGIPAGKSLSILLGSECKVTRMGVEQIAYGALAKQMSPGAVFAAIEVQSPETEVFLHADFATVLPMIDLMLGGAGHADEADRTLTEIEQEIFKPAVDLFSAELRAIWTPLVKSSLRYRYCGAGEDLLSAAKQVLSLKFEIQIGEFHGVWNLILSPLLASALIRRIEQQNTTAENDAGEGTELRLRECLLDSRFRMELALPPTTVSVRALARLKEGQVVVLKQHAGDPIEVSVEGVHLFQAFPVSCGEHRGAQIKQIFPIAPRDEKEKR